MTTAELVSGQELIYSGRFGAAQLYFAALTRDHAADPAGPALLASALIWWSEARQDDGFQADSIDLFLDSAVARAQRSLDSAATDSARVGALFWLGTAYGYRARQADLHGRVWRAVRDAKAMRGALERAVAIDSTCADCVLGLGVYEYALARASAVARLVARIIGLGGGDVDRSLGYMRRAADAGVLTKTEARWVYASALLREGPRDNALREQGLRLIGELADQFPDNPVFQRARAPAGAP